MSVGNMRAYHESIWGGGHGPRETLATNDGTGSTYPKFACPDLGRYKSLVFTCLPYGKSDFEEFEIPASVGTHTVGGIVFELSKSSPSLSTYEIVCNSGLRDSASLLQGILKI